MKANTRRLKSFKKKKGLNNSEAVNLLIRNHLIENDDIHEVEQIHHLYNERLEHLEKSFDNCFDMFFKVNRECERLAKIVGGLEAKITFMLNTKSKLAKTLLNYKEKLNLFEDKLNELLRRENQRFSHWLEDEQIAAVTGQSVWKVRLWRYGQQKPRGKRIKGKLAPYEIVDSRWKKIDS